MTLPNFFIIGASKTGTHSLYEYLRQHPEIFMPKIKAPRFFCNYGQVDYRFRFRTLEQYEALFDDAKDEKAIGEATDVYMNYRATAGRIKEVVPHAKLIAILREPVQRSFSIYHMNLRNAGKNEGLGFLDALEGDPELRHLYYDGLAPFYEHFGRDKIFTVMFEDLSSNTVPIVQEVFKFLGVDPDFVPAISIANPGGIPKSQTIHSLLNNPRLKMFSQKYVPDRISNYVKGLRNANLKKHAMTEAEREGAYKHFHEDLLKTQELIGKDLSRWIRADAAAPAPRQSRAASG